MAPNKKEFNKVCETCSNGFRVQPSYLNKIRFCSKECRTKSPEPRRGLHGGRSNWTDYPNTTVNGICRREHVHIAEKVLGRPLKSGECVHHIDGNKTNNKHSNLLICTKSYHIWLHWRMSYLYQREHFA